MDNIQAYISSDILKIQKLVRDYRTRSVLLVIMASDSSPLSSFRSTIEAEDFIDVHVTSLPELERYSFNSEEIGSVCNILVNCVEELSHSDLKRAISLWYAKLAEYYKRTFIFLVNRHQYSTICSQFEHDGIPRHLLKLYCLGEVELNDFSNWLIELFPGDISKEIVEILIEGTGTDFTRATILRDTLFGRYLPQLYFISERDFRVKMGQFGFRSNRRIQDEEGNSLRIPIKRFIFDSSAIGSQKIRYLIEHVGTGEYIYPRFIRDEVHGLEEKFKKRKKKNPINRNLKLIREKLKRRIPNEKGIQNNKRIDLKLIDCAEQNSAIIITADIGVYESSVQTDIPVILIPPN